MNKNKLVYGIITFFLSICVFITPTLGKYVSTQFGVAGILAFTPLIPTGIFIVENEDFFNSDGSPKDKVQSDSKWGAGDSVKEKGEKELENTYGISSLENVLFSIKNISNKRLLVNFYVELYFKSNIGTDVGLTVRRTNFTAQVTNITENNQSVTGNYKYTTEDKNGNIFSKTISPTDTSIFPNMTSQTVENLFVLNPSEYMEYNVKIEGDSDLLSSVGDWLSTNCYYSFHMVVTEYNP